MSRDFRIDAPRLYLRLARSGDFKIWRTVREDSRAHLQPWEPLWSQTANSRKDWNLRIKAWREGWRDERACGFLVFAKQDDALLGGVALTNIRRGAAQTASLGYWLGVHATGQGYMCEAVQHICAWAGTGLKLARIEASTLPENHKSRRVLTRCGFREEGLAQSYLQIAGKRRDHVLYGLAIERFVE